MVLTGYAHPQYTIPLATQGIALAFLGPGSLSIDACMFGRKLINIWSSRALRFYLFKEGIELKPVGSMRSGGCSTFQLKRRWNQFLLSRRKDIYVCGHRNYRPSRRR